MRARGLLQEAEVEATLLLRARHSAHRLKRSVRSVQHTMGSPACLVARVGWQVMAT